MENVDKPLTGRILEKIASHPVLRKAYFLSRRIPVLKQLLHSCANEAFPTGRRIWFRVPRGSGKGLWFLADPRFDPDYLSGEHERWVQDLLEKRLKPGDCFFDVGAHIGFFSVIAARLVGPTGSAWAFEPDDVNLGVLRANSARNKLSNLTIIAAAVWDCSGQLAFAHGAKASARMEGRVVDKQQDTSDVVTVTAVSLDDFVFEDPQRAPRFLKIDVEGGEFRVLSGATRVLRQFHPLLLCEVHNLELVIELRTFLLSMGYAAEEHPSGGKSYVWAEPAL
jgi:FkbM family methyltransferase